MAIPPGTPIEPATQDPGSDFYKTLVESTKAIAWSIDWATKKFTYIGPQIEALPGWAPESWKRVVERKEPHRRGFLSHYDMRCPEPASPAG